MTQLPSEATVVGNFDDHVVDLSAGTFRFYRRGEEFWIEVPESWADQVERTFEIPSPSLDQQVVMLTGFHHQQVYWLEVEGHILAAGVNWVKDFGQYVTLGEVFLKPGKNQKGVQEWTNNCVRCHSTPAWRGAPKENKARRGSGPAPLRVMPPLSFTESRPLDRFGELSTDAISIDPPLMPELGISCEACHGRAEEHIELYSSPLRRYAKHLNLGDADTGIINPEKLSAEESSRLCGSCHAPRPAMGVRPKFRDWKLKDPKYSWPDRMIRSGGRGYVAVTKSPCFAGGEFGCLTCHSMHDAPPSDQLSAGQDGNDACIDCHSTLAAELEKHTHHAPESAGSLCYDCHMPHTAFNLLKATRSHQIDSPNVAVNLETGRPNGCNLCHLDRSLGWTADYLSSWYGQPKVELNERQRVVSAAVLGAMEGDAMIRALYGWSMGWQPAQEASGRSWFVPVLAYLLNDSYSAVRAVATRSLRTVPGWDDFENDPWNPPRAGKQSKRAIRKIVDLWERDGPAPDRTGENVLLRKDGTLNWKSTRKMLARRDRTEVQISE
ncbi:MAG: cytochrome c3 family protein [Longimicrobiales bacterium]